VVREEAAETRSKSKKRRLKEEMVQRIRYLEESFGQRRGCLEKGLPGEEGAQRRGCSEKKQLREDLAHSRSS
jgi:hypothetical protein